MQSFSLDLATLLRKYEAGLSPVDVIEMVYAKIDAAGDPGIFISLCPKDKSIERARKLGPFRPDLPLYGVPFAIKDNIDLAGLPTTAACADFAYTPDDDAFVVRLLMDAGAIPVGKTNLDQFATGLVGVRSPWPPPRNTFDPAIVPGGSSSGSAVAVARGLVSFSLGTDTAGSGRVPAGLNNLVGLKPTLGALSTRGVVPACRTLDCVSVFALTVADAFDVYRCAAKPDAQDPYSRAMHAGRMGVVPKAFRLGVPDMAGRIFSGDTHSAGAFDLAIAQMCALGAQIELVDMSGFFETARLLYEGPWVAERYLAARELVDTSPDSLLPVTRGIISGASRFSAADTFAAQYRLAELRRKTEPLWTKIDALMTPTFPKPRTLADLAADPIGPNSELGTYTNFVNLLDLCALAVPAGLRGDGFPASVTLIASAGRDDFLATLGSALHGAMSSSTGATGHDLPPPPAPPDRAGDGEYEIVVVGAHMSGMALSSEMTGLGGRFLRTVATMNSYKFYALPGGPPFRPGMVRVGSGEGASIAAEVWSLPAAGFARFVNAIPPPLGIGTIQLTDGTTPKGFLAEHTALADARDITSFGGWRAYVKSMDNDRKGRT